MVQLHTSTPSIGATLPTMQSCDYFDNSTFPLWHHNGCLLWYQYMLVMQHISWFCKLHLNKTIGWWVSRSQQWYNLFFEWFLCKLTFSFLQINPSNIRFEMRIHQLNDNVDSTSDIYMFSILCSDIKVTFIIYLGWILNSAMSVYVKLIFFKIAPQINMKDPISSKHLTTYKFISIQPPHLNYNKNINEKYFTTKYAMSSQ